MLIQREGDIDEWTKWAQKRAEQVVCKPKPTVQGRLQDVEENL